MRADGWGSPHAPDPACHRLPRAGLDISLSSGTSVVSVALGLSSFTCHTGEELNAGILQNIH